MLGLLLCRERGRRARRCSLSDSRAPFGASVPLAALPEAQASRRSMVACMATRRRAIASRPGHRLDCTWWPTSKRHPRLRLGTQQPAEPLVRQRAPFMPAACLSSVRLAYPRAPHLLADRVSQSSPPGRRRRPPPSSPCASSAASTSCTVLAKRHFDARFCGRSALQMARRLQRLLLRHWRRRECRALMLQPCQRCSALRLMQQTSID